MVLSRDEAVEYLGFVRAHAVGCSAAHDGAQVEDVVARHVPGAVLGQFGGLTVRLA